MRCGVCGVQLIVTHQPGVGAVIHTGPRATLQVRRGDLGRVVGKYAEVHRREVPDVAGRG